MMKMFVGLVDVYVCGTKSIPILSLIYGVNEQSLSLGYHSNRLATQTRCYRPNSCFLTKAQINIWKGKQYAQRQTRPQ